MTNQTRMLTAALALSLVGCGAEGTHDDAGAPSNDAQVEHDAGSTAIAEDAGTPGCGAERPSYDDEYRAGADFLDCVSYVPFGTIASAPLEHALDPIYDPRGSFSRDNYDAERLVETEAIVRANCQTRGCWMELRDTEDPASESVTVRFRNYGFFVPIRSRNANVRLQGVFLKQHLTPADVAHYESEGMTFDHKNDDGSADVFEFSATSVQMWNLP